MSSQFDYESIASALDVEQTNKDEAELNSVILLCGKDLNPEPIEWLWSEWLAKGKLHILAGAPGQGKTTLALTLAATVSVGGAWPDGTSSQEDNILIWSGEDDAADTLLPRLLAAGADRNKCYFVNGTRVDGEIRSFDPSRDLLDLEKRAKAMGGVSLIIVDPVVSAITGDSHKNTEVRRALQPVVDLAKRLNAAVLGITHFSKGGAGSDPMMRVVGSVAFTAVARVVLVAAKVKNDEGEPDRRIFARTKSNIGPDEGGFEYFIDQTEPLPGIHASRITWGQSVSGSAKELFADPEQEKVDGDDSKNAIGQAMEFLVQALSEGTTPSKNIQKEARENGIAPRTLRRATQQLNVVSKKGAGGIWYLKLPDSPFGLQYGGQKKRTEINLTKHDGHAVQLLNHGQHGQVDIQVENTPENHPKKPDDVGHVGHDLNLGQVEHVDGQVEWGNEDGEIV